MSHVDSASLGGGGRGPRRASHDFELNLASIIDCFVVLIAFLLISSSFLAIGMLDAGVQAASYSPETDQAPAPIRVTVELAQDHSMRVKVAGKVTDNLRVAALEGGKPDFVRAKARLADLRQAYPSLDFVVLGAEGDVPYGELVAALESLRGAVPSVLLGEF